MHVIRICFALPTKQWPGSWASTVQSSNLTRNRTTHISRAVLIDSTTGANQVYFQFAEYNDTIKSDGRQYVEKATAGDVTCQSMQWIRCVMLGGPCGWHQKNARGVLPLCLLKKIFLGIKLLNELERIDHHREILLKESKLSEWLTAKSAYCKIGSILIFIQRKPN